MPLLGVSGSVGLPSVVDGGGGATEGGPTESRLVTSGSRGDGCARRFAVKTDVQ